MARFNKIFSKLNKITKDIIVEGGILSIILVVSLLLLVSNIFRVISNGRSNFEVYLFEQEGYNSLKERNEELLKDSSYYSSDEYRLLFLRDTELLGLEGETIYTTRKNPVYFDENKTLLDISKVNDYKDWWTKLLF